MRTTYPNNYWKLIVFTFCMGWMVIWIYRSMLSPIFPEMQATIGHQSNTALGLIVSCYFFGYTAFQIPFGWVVDKIGQKKVLIPGFIIFALGVYIIGMASHITTMYIGAVMAGIGCSSYYAVAFSLTTQHVPTEKKGIATAIVNSGSALGMILGLTGASFLVKQLNLQWQTIVFIAASLIVLLIIWFVFMIKSTAYNNSEITTSKTIETNNKSSLFTPKLIACYILDFTTCYAYYLVVTWLPKFLESERGISGSMIGIITSMIAVTAVPGALYFAHLSDKHRQHKTFIIIGLEIAAFILIALSMFAPNATTLTIILLLYGFLGKMAVDPVLISYLSDHANKNNLAATLGTFNFFAMSSSVIAPTLTGMIIDKTGSGVWGFYIGAILLFIGTCVFTIMTRTSK